MGVWIDGPIGPVSGAFELNPDTHHSVGQTKALKDMQFIQGIRPNLDLRC